MTTSSWPLAEAGDENHPQHTMLGLAALAAELAAEGVSVDALFERSDVAARALEDPNARLSYHQRLIIFQNAIRLAPRADIGLLAGSRQRISDFGIYGYAMLSSQTFADALKISLDYLPLAGAMFQVRYLTDGDDVVLRSSGYEKLGPLLPFAAEFWRSSITALFSRVLEAPFPSKRMRLTYSAPPHWRAYERLFNCPVEFDSAYMEWRFDSSVLEKKCPNANPITAQVCQQLCERILCERVDMPDLARRIRTEILNASGPFPSAIDVAARVGMSVRSLHRRLSELGFPYQSILDDVRQSLAIEFLRDTRLPMEEIAQRVGFSDAKAFRKSFRKWTGNTPSHYRSGDT
ncbi:AraC family transcriptional regulator [Paraburkholderia sp. C35]|uniref:AraC family transcriptional regulator n=1 Tax=Paraburkholderia sp. C35 TaxID=2126993 RepID=UPI001951445A|nr:AraC family transcriptional regulator [Paraburkholderia sp. C35]